MYLKIGMRLVLFALCALFFPRSAVAQEDVVEMAVHNRTSSAVTVFVQWRNGARAGGRPEELSEEDWHTVLNTNVTSAFLCSKAIYPELKKAGGGKILNCGSMTTLFGVPFAPAYGASKGAIAQLTKSLATAWAADNIQVNCFLPGWINTALTEGAKERLPDLHDSVLNRTPAGRWGEPKDLEGIAVFLASDASDFITGAVIPVDGGYSASG